MGAEHEERLRTWLTEDQLRPRKYRRKTPVLFRQLQEEGSYTGSDRTVRHYVKKIKVELVRKEPHARLEHAPGAAQVDFRDTLTVLAGDETHERVAHKPVMSFPYNFELGTRTLTPSSTGSFITHTS
ncbi:MAG: hypothetical protein KGZ50_10520 [Peptococcaceae bacterium]|nr:hypothetical protein [Peptococcaceae bacterium]